MMIEESKNKSTFGKFLKNIESQADEDIPEQLKDNSREFLTFFES